MRRDLPVVPNLQQQKTLSKTLRKQWTEADPDAYQRIRESHPKLLEATDAEVAAFPFKLSDAQLVIAREYGIASWQKPIDQIAERRPAVGLSSRFSIQRDQQLRHYGGVQIDWSRGCVDRR